MYETYLSQCGEARISEKTTTPGGGQNLFQVASQKTGGPFYVDFREIRGPGSQSAGDDFRRNMELPGTHRTQSAESGAIDRRNSRFQAKTPQKHRKMQEKRCKTPVWASQCMELPIGRPAQNGEGSTYERCRKWGEKLRRFLCFFIVTLFRKIAILLMISLQI